VSKVTGRVANRTEIGPPVRIPRDTENLIRLQFVRSDPIKRNVKRRVSPRLNAENCFLSIQPNCLNVLWLAKMESGKRLNKTLVPAEGNANRSISGGLLYLVSRSTSSESNSRRSEKGMPCDRSSSLYIAAIITPLGRSGGAGLRVADVRRPDHPPSRGLCPQAFLCRGRDAFDLHDNSGRNQRSGASGATRPALSLYGRQVETRRPP
jgi:hypothetical protein